MSGYQAGVEGLWEFAVPHIAEPVNPAAGANYSVNLDARWWWRLRLATFYLSTSATVANRYVSITLGTIDTNAIVIGAAAVVVTASTTNQRFAGSSHRGDSEWNTGTDVLFPIDDYPMAGGRTLSINVANIQSTDQLSTIKLAFMRLPTSQTIVDQYAGVGD